MAQTLIHTAETGTTCSQPARNATYRRCTETTVCGVDMGDGRQVWYCADHAPQMWKRDHAPATTEPRCLAAGCDAPGMHSVKVDGVWTIRCDAHNPARTIAAKRTKKSPAADLPRIIRFDGKSDAGEYGAATCPHCGADGRYVWSFLCEDGTRRGAMAGCIRLFPVSAVADEHRKIMERQADREKKGRNLASWDVAKLAAIEAFHAGETTEGDALRTIETQNAKRTAWMNRR
jgi:hypothetical protein